MNFEIIDGHSGPAAVHVPLSGIAVLSLDDDEAVGRRRAGRGRGAVGGPGGDGGDVAPVPAGYDQTIDVRTVGRPAAGATAPAGEAGEASNALEKPAPLVRGQGDAHRRVNAAAEAVFARAAAAATGTAGNNLGLGPNATSSNGSAASASSHNSASSSSSSSQQSEMSTLIARWRIPSADVLVDVNNLLGRGNYGAVYAGKCRGSSVAIKRLNTGSDSDFDIQKLRGLLSEADAMTKAQNPHVLLMLGVVVEPGNVALVTELMPNGSVEDWLVVARSISSGSASAAAAAAPLPLSASGHLSSDPSSGSSLGSRRRAFMRSPWFRCQFVRDAAVGLSWLHGKGIIHRDLKPQNLLVDGGFRVKVCDFGFSIQVAGRGAFSDAAPRGSPMYMAPECLRGEPFNTASDVYSLSLIAWETITLGLLFPKIYNQAALRAAVCERHVRPPLGEDPAWLPQHPVSTVSSLGRLLRAAWAPSPLARCNAETFLAHFDPAAVAYVLETSRIAGPPAAQALKLWLTVTTQGRAATSENGPAAAWWSDLQNELERTSRQTAPVAENVWHALRALCEMPALMPSPSEHFTSGMVSFQRFTEILRWFGPVNLMLERIKDVALGPSAKIPPDTTICAFHARITKDEAERILEEKSRPAGSFLLRFSSEPGSFCLSCKASTEKASSPAVLHFRVGYGENNKYWFDGQAYASLREFVEAVRPNFSLTDPVLAPPLLPADIEEQRRSNHRIGYQDNLNR